MEKRKNNRAAFALALACGLVFSLLCGLARFDAACQTLRDGTLRVHILANSDSAADQARKLQVRDALLADGAELFSGVQTLSQALDVARENLPRLTRTARNALDAAGCDDPVRLSLERARFNTRRYGDVTLPAGIYDALRVEIGDAAGANWWCVLFPALCVGAAGESDLHDAVEDDGAYIASHAPKFRVRFKIVEYYERLRAFFAGETEYRR